jgi:hypothetical protein
MAASSSAVTGLPPPRWLISQFWQNWQRNEHHEKKMVPDPRRPLSGRSSPWWGPNDDTTASSPVRQTAQRIVRCRSTRQ